jgi:hypothetical protein
MSFRPSTGLVKGMMDTSAFKTLMANGIIEVFSGAQPANADAVETGTKLLRITLTSGAFSAGVATNGLEFDTAAVAGVIAKAPAEVWSGVGLANGVAGWYRFYANAYVTGASTSAVRYDGACGTAGSQFNMSSTTIATGATTTVDSCTVTLPMS